MYSEARKLLLVEKLLKIKDETLLVQIENILKQSPMHYRHKKQPLKTKPSDYAGCISKDEATHLINEIQKSRNEWERDI